MRSIPGAALKFGIDHFHEYIPIFTQNIALSYMGQARFRNRHSDHFHNVLEYWQSTVNGPEGALREIQRSRLIRLIDRAREHAPFYKNLPAPSRASDAEEAIAETLDGMPILEKRVYRENTDDLLVRGIPSKRLRHSMTSGTTGTALRLFHTPEAEAEEYATVWRLREQLGVSLHDPHYTFTGQVIVPVTQMKPPFWRFNGYGNQFLFSLYHMSPDNLEVYIDEMHENDVVYAAGYPSALHLLARAMLSSGTTLPRGQLKAVFTSSESLLAFQREAIEEAFGAKVWDRYGTAEFAVSMTGCRLGNLHVDMEYCIVEVEPVEETDEYVRGQLLVTGLSNDATPFIRYRIGDIGTRSKKPCPCGRPGDVFLDVDGRTEDLIITPSGRMIGRMDHIFKSMPNIEEAQIMQDSPNSIEVIVVPGKLYDTTTEVKLRREIRKHLGHEIQIHLNPVTEIAREPNGKFRAVKSTLGPLQN
jgi:phenylacetate-CoA ligase